MSSSSLSIVSQPYCLPGSLPSPELTDNISKHNVTGFSISSLELIVRSYCLLQSDIRHQPAIQPHPSATSWRDDNYHQAALLGFISLKLKNNFQIMNFLGFGRLYVEGNMKI